MNAMKVTTIDGTQHAKCELCGKFDELRPYGPNGESVCFDCGMKDEEPPSGSSESYWTTATSLSSTERAFPCVSI